MGFCLFNNVAVGAAHALARGLDARPRHRLRRAPRQRHAGDLLRRSARALRLEPRVSRSIRGPARSARSGKEPGRGFTVNLPLPAGCGDAEYDLLYREIVVPIGRAFDPQLVLVSVGFDPHAADPLAGHAGDGAGLRGR